MQGTAKITSFQFYSILYMGRVFTLVTFMANFNREMSPTDSVLACVFMLAYLLLTALPAFFLIKQDSESSVIARAECLSGKLGAVFALIYLVDFLFSGTVTAARFEMLASSVMFPESNMLYAVAILLAAASYAAYKGIEALGRSGTVFLLPVLLSFVFVFLALLKRFDKLNFEPIFADGAYDSAAFGIYSASRTEELLAVSLMTPFVKKQKKHHLFVWIAAVFVTVFATYIMLAGVLGNFGSTQLFSMYSMSVIAEFGFIRRTDAIITCIWMLCAGVKLSFVLYVCEYLLERLVKKGKKALYLFICALFMFAGTCVLSYGVNVFSAVVTSRFSFVIYLVSACFPPLAVIFGEKIKKSGVTGGKLKA